MVVEKEEDVEGAIALFEKTLLKKVLVVSQTTYSLHVFEKCVKKIEQLIPPNVFLEVKNTICATTEMRQKEAQELSKKVDRVIVIGGKNSSNTLKLFEICSQNCSFTQLIQNEEELVGRIPSSEVIGIVAGASTPQESIEAVVLRIKELETEDISTRKLKNFIETKAIT